MSPNHVNAEFDEFATRVPGLDRPILDGSIRYPKGTGLFGIISGDPGSGKSILALQIAFGACCRYIRHDASNPRVHHDVTFFTFEKPEAVVAKLQTFHYFGYPKAETDKVELLGTFLFRVCWRRRCRMMTILKARMFPAAQQRSKSSSSGNRNPKSRPCQSTKNGKTRERHVFRTVPIRLGRHRRTGAIPEKRGRSQRFGSCRIHRSKDSNLRVESSQALHPDETGTNPRHRLLEIKQLNTKQEWTVSGHFHIHQISPQDSNGELRDCIVYLVNIMKARTDQISLPGKGGSDGKQERPCRMICIDGLDLVGLQNLAGALRGQKDDSDSFQFGETTVTDKTNVNDGPNLDSQLSPLVYSEQRKEFYADIRNHLDGFHLLLVLERASSTAPTPFELADQYSVDMFMRLGFIEREHTYIERYLEITKARYQYYCRGRHNFSIKGDQQHEDESNPTEWGIVLYPDLPACYRDLSRNNPLPDRGDNDIKGKFSLGVKSLDDFLQNIKRHVKVGDVNLLVSELGTKSTTIGIHFAMKAVADGECEEASEEASEGAKFDAVIFTADYGREKIESVCTAYGLKGDMKRLLI